MWVLAFSLFFFCFFLLFIGTCYHVGFVCVITENGPSPTCSSPQTGGGSKSPCFTLQPQSWRSTKMSIEHISWLSSDALTIVQLSPKPQMSEHRSSTMCAVVKWPDHHCGDDLVDKTSDLNSSALLISLVHHDAIWFISWINLTQVSEWERNTIQICTHRAHI